MEKVSPDRLCRDYVLYGEEETVLKHGLLPHELTEFFFDDTNANLLKEYMTKRNMKDIVNIYNKMVLEANNGDSSAAKWVSDFQKTKFFSKEEKSELERIMDSINL